MYVQAMKLLSISCNILFSRLEATVHQLADGVRASLISYPGPYTYIDDVPGYIEFNVISTPSKGR